MIIHSVNLQRGLSLIEALIALLVLSIGLVGMGALMLTSMKNVHSSAHYSVASAIVLDFEELLWEELAKTAVSSPSSLDDADGCLSNSDIDDLATAVETEWQTGSLGEGAWSDADRFKLPDILLDVDTANIDVDCVEDDSGACLDRDEDGIADVNWKMVPVELKWTEGRFSDVADVDAELDSYSASITLPCRPTFLGGIAI